MRLRMLHKLENLPPVSLAEGFSIRPYRPGDEAAWVAICKHGLLKETAGLEKWEKNILGIPTLVPQRDVFFVCDRAGNPVATLSAYLLSESRGNAHMLACKTESRGHGIGVSLMCHILHKMKAELAEGGMLGLQTEDQLLAAIKGYLRLGYQPVNCDTDMVERWTAICDKLNIHGVTMVDEDGKDLDIII